MKNIDTNSIRIFLKSLKYSKDERSLPDNNRRGNFKSGWNDFVEKGISYQLSTLSKSLTWQNLGNRFGAEFGERSSVEIHEVYDELSIEYKEVRQIHDEIIYQASKKVYEKEISKSEGVNRLIEKLNMNKGSAQIIIGQVFPKLIKGEQFSRTLSVKLFDYFLKRILDDYGKSKLAIALKALKLHIDYIAEKGDAKIKLRKVYQRYIDSLKFQSNEIENDEKEQKEISEYYKKTKSREEIIKELKNKKDADAEKVTINHKAFKRDNKTIAIIKILRNFECQICGLSIIKRDGGKYVEAAHIIPKHKKGNEKPGNIILLCPNHHKEFDLGHCEIKEHTNDEVKFTMNGNRYELSLSIE